MTLGCLAVVVFVTWTYEVGTAYLQGKQPRYYESFSTISIVMFALILLKGKVSFEYSDRD